MLQPRSEPLLWLQLLAAPLLPLEALLVLLLLAGSDPGPLPGLERLLCWAIGVLAPCLLLWRQPADVWSLLLAQTPLRGRRPLQSRLSALQGGLPLQVGLALGAALGLPLLWWLDANAAVAAAFSPLPAGPRLLALLLSAPVLALMLWQWQQLLQALWLLSRSPEQVAAAAPLGQQDLEQRRLCLGLPLLLPDPLLIEAPPAQRTTETTPAADPPAPAHQSQPEPPAPAAAPDPTPAAAPDPEPAPSAEEEPGEADGAGSAAEVGALSPVAVDEEQAAEEAEGPDLDQQVD